MRNHAARPRRLRAGESPQSSAKYPDEKCARASVFQPRRGGQQSNARINLRCARKTPRRRQRHPSPRLLQVHTSKIDGRSLAGRCALHRHAPRMHAADPDAAVRGEQLQFVARSHLARNQRTSDHRPEALHYKCPVDRQAKISAAILFGRGDRNTSQLRLELLEARAGFCTNGNYRSTFEERSLQEFGNLQAYGVPGYGYRPDRSS